MLIAEIFMKHGRILQPANRKKSFDDGYAQEKRERIIGESSKLQQIDMNFVDPNP